jgi:hypothetical protein
MKRMIEIFCFHIIQSMRGVTVHILALAYQIKLVFKTCIAVFFSFLVLIISN